MVTIALISYVALNILLYRIIKIKPRPTNIAAVVVLGVFIIGSIVIQWKYAAPMASNVVVTRYTVPLVSQVTGPIDRIVAKPNSPLKKNEDVLFEIQKQPYEMALKQVEASLQSARTKVEQLTHGIEAATAAIRKAEAGLAAAKAALQVVLNTQEINPDAVSELQIKQLQSQLGAAVASLDQARAAELQAKSAQKAAQENVVSIEAQVERAQFNLHHCTVYAPADGFVTNWQAREGTMAAMAPVGTFVDTSTTALVASFPQNTATHIAAGDKIEIALKSRPGEVFAGTVDAVIQATGEGQFSPGAALQSASTIGSRGMIAVKFQLDDQDVAATLPVGAAGNVAVYTDHGSMFHTISRVTIRMNTWMYYLLPF